MARPMSHTTYLPDPISTDFSALHDLARRLKLVFRVHSSSASCASPLLWTGHTDTSGFCSPNGNLACLSPSVHTRTFGAHRGGGDGWADGAWIVQSMVDHIGRKPKATRMFIPSTLEERPASPQDDKSPWISTSRSLTWCVWEIARRLSLAPVPYHRRRRTHQQRSPQQQQQRQRHANGDRRGQDWSESRENVSIGNQGESQVELAIIKHHGGTVSATDDRRRFLELHVAPADRIRKALQSAGRDGLSVSAKEAYDAARRACLACEEILYYGRIFTESIDSNLVFTQETLPLDLPPHFTRPEPYPVQARASQEKTLPSQEKASRYQANIKIPQTSPPRSPSASILDTDTDADSDSGSNWISRSASGCNLDSGGKPGCNSDSGSKPSVDYSLSASRVARRQLQGWLGRLVWDPKVDSYEVACGKIRKNWQIQREQRERGEWERDQGERGEEARTSRGGW